MVVTAVLATFTISVAVAYERFADLLHTLLLALAGAAAVVAIATLAIGIPAGDNQCTDLRHNFLLGRGYEALLCWIYDKIQKFRSDYGLEFSL